MVNTAGERRMVDGLRLLMKWESLPLTQAGDDRR